MIYVQVEQFFSVKNNGTNVETRLVNQHLQRALRGSNFKIMDITRMSEYRADAHPSTAGGKRHDDCMHWCLPGLTDTWNDLFVAHLNSIRLQNQNWVFIHHQKRFFFLFPLVLEYYFSNYLGRIPLLQSFCMSCTLASDIFLCSHLYWFWTNLVEAPSI